jgi:hypothetical protein
MVAHHSNLLAYLNSHRGQAATNNLHTPTTLMCTWQHIDAVTCKIKIFKEQALHTSSFMPFLLMMERLHLLSINFKVMVYSHPTAIAELNNKPSASWGSKPPAAN